VSVDRLHLFIRSTALAAIFTILLVAAATMASSASAKQRTKSARAGVADARGLAQPSRCARSAMASRARRMTLKRRKRTLRRMRVNCQRRSARKSTALPTGKYWGAWIGSQLTGDEAPWDMGAVEKFEQLAGKRMSAIHFSSPFANCSSSCDYYEFPTGPMEDIREHGSIPFFSWGSQSTPANLNQPNFQLSDVISGAHDAFIREFAEEAREWGHPFFLRFNWEMNGKWFAWMEGVNGNQPGEAVAAWRHVHDIFTEVGATNATWVWCPNVDPDGELRDLASLYPGDAYVDWTGLDGYNWGTHPARDDIWRSFDDLYRSTYEYITETLAPTKPLAIAEIGSTEHGGSKGAWIEDALSSVAADYPQVRALLWFEKFDDGMDWPIETSGAATGAFAAGIQSPLFAGNSFAALSATTIPSPS
jgi:mannan endo-1,4-beta-mannosidase